MSYLHCQRLASVRDEYLAAKAAIAYLTRVWHELGNAPEIKGISLFQMREAADQLASTYIIRLFSEFEAILQHHLETRRNSVPDRAFVLI